MEREQLVQHLDAAAHHARKAEEWLIEQETVAGPGWLIQLSVTHSLVVIATLLDQIVGRDGLSVGTVRTESGI